MATYMDRAALLTDPTFRSRVQIAVMTAAITSALSPQGATESLDAYRHRVRFSIDVVFTAPDQYLNAFVSGLLWDSDAIPGMVDILAAAADATSAGDAQIQQAVNAVFNFMVTSGNI